MATDQSPSPIIRTKLHRVLSTYYRNGDVAPQSPLRDFHLPSQIPVGEKNENYDLDFHVKESRFNLGTTSEIDGREFRGFLEMDFLLSKQGDEKVSNSFNPRMRHFYFQTGRWLFGQTWTIFMIIVLPEDLDFSGAAEGIVFGRQPQLRFTHGPWQVSVENPETALTLHQGAASIVSESGRLPDLVARRNFKGDWGTLGISVIGRQLHYNVVAKDINDQAFGFGASLGTQINVGKRDDFLLQVTAGRGLGRYVALNFVNAAVADTTGGLHTIDEVAGFVGYRHYWNEKLRTSVNVSMFTADNPTSVSGGSVNKEAQSYSANLLYSPVPKWTLGVEFIHARRALEDGTDGTMGRLQLSARWDFGYTAGRPPKKG
jgi:hypothetical protein